MGHRADSHRLEGLLTCLCLASARSAALPTRLPTTPSRAAQLHLHDLRETSGAGGLPAAVQRVLNSKACRGAVMFGDELTGGQVGGETGGGSLQLHCAGTTLWCHPGSPGVFLQCQELLDGLKGTQQCFSCAHGRPTTAPLVDLQLLRQALRLRAEARPSGQPGAGAGSRNCSAAAPPGLTGIKARLLRHLGVM